MIKLDEFISHRIFQIMMGIDKMNKDKFKQFSLADIAFEVLVDEDGDIENFTGKTKINFNVKVHEPLETIDVNKQ
jgi:arginine decarboxylase-like protein